MTRIETDDALPELPCACASLRRAARAATQLYDAELRSTGLRSTQWTLLQVLARRGPLSQGGLGDLLALDSTTLSRTLRPLERERLLEAQPGKDRRERRWAITTRGRTRLRKGQGQWERAQERLRRQLGAQSFKTLLRTSAVVAEAAVRA